MCINSVQGVCLLLSSTKCQGGWLGIVGVKASLPPSPHAGGSWTRRSKYDTGFLFPFRVSLLVLVCSRTYCTVLVCKPQPVQDAL